MAFFTEPKQSDKACENCGHVLVQNNPGSIIYGCRECQITWRMVGGRLTRETGRLEILKRMFWIRYYKQDAKDNLQRLLRVVRPWWKVW